MGLPDKKEDTLQGIITYELREAIRSQYKLLMPFIEKYYPCYDPYIFDFDIPLTPIEENVWTDIRFTGLPIKCMQFPVKQYFIDFADPIKNIGIEVDGRRYHTDKDKDRKRQEEIEAEGWTIYRIEGWQTVRECSEGIIRYIQDKHYQNLYLHNYISKLKKDATDAENKIHQT